MKTKVLTTEQSLCLQHLEEALSTDPERTRKDIIYGKKTLCGMPLDQHQLILMLLLLSKTTTTGKYALTYHRMTNQALKQHDVKMLKRLINQSIEESLPEVFDNPYLNEEERQRVLDVIVREYDAMKNAIYYHSQQPDASFMTCDIHEQFVDYDESDQNVKSSTLLCGCYAKECIEHDVISSVTTPTSIRFIEHHTRHSDNPVYNKIYQFDIEELLPILSQKKLINPRNGKPFNKSSVDLLRKRLNIELKLYKRFTEL